MPNVEIIKAKDTKIDSKGNEVKNKLRVAAYARVSTDHDDQQTSFESQQIYYLDKIKSNPNWTFVDIYADEGISGTQAYRRENFMRMIRDCEEGKIDLVLTKSISRFARNTLDTLKYVRKLRDRRIGIMFEEEGINTLDMAGELLLTVLSSVAQQESETISSHVKLGFKMKRERGEMVGFNSCYGYVYNDKKDKMIINEEQAKYVRMIFQWYLNGYGGRSIAKMLTEMGIPSPTGRDHWCENSVTGIIRNEKYVGDLCQGKTYTTDAVTHKVVKNKGEEDMYYTKDHHEPIISREDWDQALSILNSRNATISNGRKAMTRFTFSGRFRCGFCGKTYTKKSLYKKRPAWDCISVASLGRQYCPDSKIMHEDVIKSAFMQAYHLLTSNDSLAVNQFLEKIQDSIRSSTPSQMKTKLENELNMTQKKLSKLVDLYVDERIDTMSFDKKHNLLQNKIDDIASKIKTIDEKVIHEDNINLGIENIKREIQARETDTSPKLFDAELFDSVVDYGIIGGITENGNKEPYMIRFICKTGLATKARGDVTDETIIDNNQLGKEDSIYMPVLDFISNQHFFVYNAQGAGLKKQLITKVRVRVEVEK